MRKSQKPKAGIKQWWSRESSYQNGGTSHKGKNHIVVSRDEWKRMRPLPRRRWWWRWSNGDKLWGDLLSLLSFFNFILLLLLLCFLVYSSILMLWCICVLFLRCIELLLYGVESKLWIWWENLRAIVTGIYESTGTRVKGVVIERLWEVNERRGMGRSRS